MPHSSYNSTYILVSYSLSAQEGFPGQMLKYHPLKGNGSMPRIDVTDVSDVNRLSVSGAAWASAWDQHLTPNMATSWSISGLPSRGSDVSRYLNINIKYATDVIGIWPYIGVLASSGYR